MPYRKIAAALVSAFAMHLSWNSLLAQSLYTVPQGIESIWASPENPLGEKGRVLKQMLAERADPRFRSKPENRLR
jgi:hypothetical protein